MNDNNKKTASIKDYFNNVIKVNIKEDNNDYIEANDDIKDNIKDYIKGGY